MKIVRYLMSLLAVALMSANASAATEQFHLTYKFSPLSAPSVWIPEPWTIQADFTGTRDGDLIRKVKFTRLTVAGELLNKFGVASLAGDFGEGVLSFSGKSNDIIVYGLGPIVSFDFYSYTVNPSTIGTTFVEAGLYYTDDKHPPGGIWMHDRNVNGSWAISAVPEPASYAMLMLGLGVVALRARKHTAV
ncbi:PEP-CTERM sorting domain-containing protein [Pseudoduganella danionis]|uniref:PEP-CTERM sorting domain-containing protein n=1 Tax=Pseudoduganella danionis TaxID=1890295 RepID=A0ABW9SN15_9BURK|nr:PEP-CTERM sorting domain-containing protein [Pseudoduganella danionis]MTW33572.1 PEP-CTERM sorting domain-containing protein [Pseudoduganella danionis]